MPRSLSAIEAEKSPLLEAIENSKKLPPPAMLGTPAGCPVFQDRLAIAPPSSLDALSPSPPSRPKLPPPSSEKETHPPIFDLMELQIGAEETLGRLNHCQAEELTEATKRHETLALEWAKKQRALVEQQERASYWDSYRQIASTLTSAMTFFTAATISGAGPATAYLTYALLLSGSGALFNQGMSLSGGWSWFAGLVTDNEENRAKLASLLEKSVSIGSTLLGLVSLGVSATTIQVSNPQFWTGQLGPEVSTLFSGVSTVINVASVFLGIKSGIDTAHTYQMQEKGKQSESASALYKHRVNETTRAVQETADTQRTLNESCRDALQSYITSQKLAVQPT